MRTPAEDVKVQAPSLCEKLTVTERLRKKFHLGFHPARNPNQLASDAISPKILAWGDWRSGSAAALHAVGRGFESLIAHHSQFTPLYTGFPKRFMQIPVTFLSPETSHYEVA